MALRISRESRILISCLTIFSVVFLLNFSLGAGETKGLEKKLRFLETQKIIIIKINRLEKKLYEIQREINDLKIQYDLDTYDGEEMDHGALPYKQKKGNDGHKKTH